MEEQSKKKKLTKGDIVSFVILGVLAVILIPVFIINFTLIIKGSIRSEVPPDVFGIAPMAVTTGSMDGDRDDSFAEGALIFVDILDEKEKQSLAEGEIVTFRTNETYVTHRIVSVVRDKDNSISSVITRGDANNTDDGAIPLENVVGRCTGSIAGAGSFAMFMQTPLGIVLVVGVPILVYVAYDVIRITLNNRRVKADGQTETESEKDKEIRRLQQLLAEKENGEHSPETADLSAGAETTCRAQENDERVVSKTAENSGQGEYGDSADENSTHANGAEKESD